MDRTYPTIRVILTGSTGMVGEGVLHECLQRSDVISVLVVNRRPCGVSHPKLRELIHEDFFHLTPIREQLSGYDACFFCLGVSSVGMEKNKYYRLTYTLTMHFAQIVCEQNPGMAFCYISGAGTDSTEKGRRAWARVKGKTENDLMKLPFSRVFAVRPAFIRATPGLLHINPYYKYISWLFPLGRAIYPGGFVTMKELGNAMINAVELPYDKAVMEGKDIIQLAAVN